MAPGGIEPPRVDSKSTALSTELRGRARLHGILCERVVAVAQLVEPRVVIPVVAGSSPVRHLFIFLQELEPANAGSPASKQTLKLEPTVPGEPPSSRP